MLIWPNDDSFLILPFASSFLLQFNFWKWKSFFFLKGLNSLFSFQFYLFPKHTKQSESPDYSIYIWWEKSSLCLNNIKKQLVQVVYLLLLVYKSYSHIIRHTTHFTKYCSTSHASSLISVSVLSYLHLIPGPCLVWLENLSIALAGKDKTVLYSQHRHVNNTFKIYCQCHVKGNWW